MDHKRFDEIVKHLATKPTRRSLLKAGGIAALGAVTSRFGHSAEAAVDRGPGQICRKNADCDSNICGPTDSTGRRKCECSPAQVACGGKCVDPATAYQADKNNCGACGTRCTGGKVCCKGACVAPQQSCNGVCCTGTQICYSNSCCEPGTIETLCAGHCGETISNNCGGSVTCPACCVPDSDETTCASLCGTQTNNCDQSVDCGPCCAGTDGDCLSNSDCCSDVCVEGTCAAGPVINGQLCDDNADCLSETCCGSQCVDPATFQSDVDNCGQCGTECPGTNSECATVACNSGVCGYDYESSGTECVEVAYCDGAGTCVECTLDVHCTSEKCEADNLCCVPESEITTCDGGCGSKENNCGQSVDCGLCCTATAESCTANSECCSNVCIDGVCAAGAVANGQPCDENADCVSENCCDSVCVDPATFQTDVDNCGSCGAACQGTSTECATIVCTAGACDVENKAAGEICVEVAYCDGNGTCVECTQNSHCTSNKCEATNLCCVAETSTVTCTGKCGSQTNNCGQTVDCGVCCGTGKRKSTLGDYCVPDAAACALFAGNVSGTSGNLRDFRECDFSSKTFVSVAAAYCNLAGATFASSSLTSVSFQYSTLTNVNFTSSTLTSMDWRFANLTGANFTSASMICCHSWSAPSPATTCPDGVGITTGNCCTHMNGNTPTTCL